MPLTINMLKFNNEISLCELLKIDGVTPIELIGIKEKTNQETKIIQFIEHYRIVSCEKVIAIHKNLINNQTKQMYDDAYIIENFDYSTINDHLKK